MVRCFYFFAVIAIQLGQHTHTHTHTRTNTHTLGQGPWRLLMARLHKKEEASVQVPVGTCRSCPSLQGAHVLYFLHRHFWKARYFVLSKTTLVRAHYPNNPPTIEPSGECRHNWCSPLYRPGRPSLISDVLSSETGLHVVQEAQEYSLFSSPPS